jgi:hypothetical protein
VAHLRDGRAPDVASTAKGPGVTGDGLIRITEIE